MPNMSLQKQPMPLRDPKERATSFEEVALGYAKEAAILEAQRCLNCRNKPCVSGCPVGIDIPSFLSRTAQGEFEEAYKVISLSSSLPAVCGRVCPQETQCEAKCVRGIKGEAVGIGRVERFVADEHQKNMTAPTTLHQNGIKMAVIGAGPAGLACSGELVKLGYAVTVFEALHVAGGVLVYGIPQFRLPKQIVAGEVENLKAMGVDFETNMVMGNIKTVDELFDEGYQAVFIGTGAGLPRFMNIPGENLKGVYSANEFLTRVNLMKAYREDALTPVKRGKRVAVVGGGNVAMDAARCALRLGAEEVSIVYRRSLDEMPARREEVEHAMEEGIIFRVLTNPCEILGDDNGDVSGIVLQKMALGEADASGRKTPVDTGEREKLDVDCVIIAIGTSPNPLIGATTKGLDVNPRGCIITKNSTGLTSRERVYAGGDAVTGAATVILAMGAGKSAAQAMHQSVVESTVLKD